MRGTKSLQALGVVLAFASLTLGADISAIVAQAQNELEQQKFASAIVLLEKALPESNGDERVLRLLRAAYRGEIPRLLQAGDRPAAARYTDRLRIIEGETPFTNSTGATTAEARRAEVQGSRPTRGTDNVKVIVPDTAEGTGLGQTSSEPFAWRPAKVPILHEPLERAADSGADISARTRNLSAHVTAARPVDTATEPPAASARATVSADGDAVEQAKRLVRKADALFVARRFAEAGELYENANRAAPESLEASKDRWVYCRLARAVDQINATPSSPSHWSTIKDEVESILENVPHNAFAQSLIAMADSRSSSTNSATAKREAIVRASEPDRADPKETKDASLLAGLAARIRLAASSSAEHSSGRRFRSGQWQVLESSNFRVHATNEQLAGQVADVAESTRLELYKTWYGKLPASNWSPRCDIFIHDSAEQYARITRQGPGSPGHSQTSVESGRVNSRRIDLRRDGNDLVRAILPHEITHVVLADRFNTRAMPRWADEGMAVLTEPVEKKQAHLKNLGELLNRGSVFSARQLMTMDDYPSGSQWPMFYAESVSLVEFLVTRGGPSKFVEFMDGSLKNGYESELKRVYGFAGFEELNSAWTSGRARQVAAAIDTVASR